jgi:shikimate kinase
MRIFLAGVGCVGKTTTGARLAKLLGYRFFDLDAEIERFSGTSVERLRNRHLTLHDFRIEASQALNHILAQDDSRDCVIAFSPSGLLGGYWKVVNAARDARIVVLRDRPENILQRATFYDIDSRPLPKKQLTEDENKYYLREIKGDIAYFKPSYRRAHLDVDIAGCDADAAARKVRDALASEPVATKPSSLVCGAEAGWLR